MSCSCLHFLKVIDPASFGQRRAEVTPPARRRNCSHHSGSMDRKRGLIPFSPGPRNNLDLRRKVSQLSSPTPSGHERGVWPCAGQLQSGSRLDRAPPPQSRRRAVSPLAHVRGQSGPTVSCALTGQVFPLLSFLLSRLRVVTFPSSCDPSPHLPAQSITSPSCMGLE